MKPLLTIMTGPQGSGNHLFSKALGQNPNIWVWPNLQEKYWEGHDMEPFAEYWKYTHKLNEFDWNQSAYFITSISCPYFDDGVETTPVYHEFIKEAGQYADMQLLIIGRDQNILEYQQNRVRGKHTTSYFLDQLPELVHNYNTIFASQELLYLYKLTYLQWLEKELGLCPWEITQHGDKLDEILKTDSNRKYVQEVDSNWLDESIKLASSRRGAV
jgi:hypothetical protein